MKKIKKLIVLAVAVGMLATSVLGTSAAFDPVYYAKQNPDVVKALGDSPEMLKLHYDLFGRKEARMSNTNDVEAQLRRLFRADEYAKLFPDVQKAFGDNKEAMFQHYIAFGLLEGRRPSEQVSQAVADSLKKSVEKAMTDAKLEAKPGSAELVKVIKGEIQTTVTTKNAAQKAAEEALQQALTQVQTVLAKAVANTVKEVYAPKPSADGGSSSGGSSSIVWEPKGRKVTTLEELKQAISNLKGNTGWLGDDAEGSNILVMNNIDMGSESIDIEGNVGLYLMRCTLTSSAEKTFTIKEGVRVSVSGPGGQNGNRIINNRNDGSIFYMTGGNLDVMGGGALDGGNSACAVKIAAESGSSTGYVKAMVSVFGGLKGKYGIYIDRGVKKDASTNQYTSKNVKINVYYSSYIYGGESGICLNGYGDVTVGEPSLVTDIVKGGKNGIEIHAGTLEIQGGTITTERNSDDGAALTVSPNANSDQAIGVTIKGGVFKAENGGVPLYVKGGSNGSPSVTVTIPNDSTAMFRAKSSSDKAIKIENGATVTDSRGDQVKQGDQGSRDSDSQGSQSNPSGGAEQNGGSGDEVVPETP